MPRILTTSLSVGLLLVGSMLAMPIIATQTTTTSNNDDVPIVPADTLPAVISIDKVPVGFEKIPKAPADNPTTLEKAELGRKLFFDTILSNDGTVSCASCHQPDHGFASPDPISIGIGGAKGKRNSPSILNRVFGTHFSWDGRDESLEQQVMGPLTSETELGGDVETVIANIQKNEEYVQSFTAVFGQGKSSGKDLITTENIAKAIACFERTIVTGNSQVDRFRASEYDALSKSARQGLWIFESRGGCWKCHSGTNLTDEEFHNTGVGFINNDDPNRDTGRMEASKDEAHSFQFKTPSLRDIEHTAPYMHDGSVKTLREVVEFYNKGGAPDDKRLDKDMKPLNLSEKEIDFLVDFLKALSGDGLKSSK
ncbi:MAG: cytochrome-c peroxidase [Mariniblastus sp.]